MTRAALAVALCLLTLVIGMWTCFVASTNHQRAASLARLQRRFEMRRAANAQLEALAAAHVWGVRLEPRSRDGLGATGAESALSEVLP